MYEEAAFFDGGFLGCPPETCSSSANPGGLGFAMDELGPQPSQLDQLHHHFRLDLDQSFQAQFMAEPTTDLLSLLRLPPAEALAGEPAAPPGLLRDLFQTLPQNYGASLYGDREGDGFREEGAVFEDGGLFDFRKEGRGKAKGNFPTEKQRRAQINEKYDILKLLVPNPTKADRASVVSDTIDYINELKRTIEELTILVENKKHGLSKRRRTEAPAAAAAAVAADMESSSMAAADVDLPFAGSLRSSWLQRRSKDTFVDVRIVDDEVNVKLTRRKKPNCLLLASKAIDDLRLDLLHASGGHIGDCYVFMFNTKISEGAAVYASAVAKKLLDAMDKPLLSSPARY
ncbi:transcription factor EAT1-like [Wolffia australiana]